MSYTTLSSKSSVLSSSTDFLLRTRRRVVDVVDKGASYRRSASFLPRPGPLGLRHRHRHLWLSDPLGLKRSRCTTTPADLARRLHLDTDKAAVSYGAGFSQNPLHSTSLPRYHYDYTPLSLRFSCRSVHDCTKTPHSGHTAPGGWLQERWRRRQSGPSTGTLTS